MWLKADGFVDRAWSWWLSYHFHGTPSYILAQKLKALKVDIKRWNEHEFGNMSSLCKEGVEEPKAMDRLEEGRSLGEEERERKMVITSELEISLLQEEIRRRQKCRIRWLKEGDKCTKFFYCIANSNRRFNSIESSSINGSLSSNQAAIQDQVVHFYESLISEHCN